MPSEISKIDGKLDETLLEQSHAVSDSEDTQTTRRKPIASSGTTAFVWTISGIVLTACSSTIEDIEEFLGLDDGDSGGGRAVRVHSSPVEGARIYFDVNEDGVIDATDITLQNQQGVEVITGTDGRAVGYPGNFHGRPFVAFVDGAIDSETGQELEGQYLSYAPDGAPHLLASPITDLLARRGGDPADMIAEILPSDDPNNPTATEMEARNSLLDAIFNPASYLGGAAGDMRVEALSKYLANDKAQNVGESETPANTLITGARAIVEAIETAETAGATAPIVLDDNPADTTNAIAMTIGEHDTRVVLVNAVSPTGETLSYEITGGTGSSDYRINERGVISVVGTPSIGTTTLQVAVTSGSGDTAMTTMVEVTVTVQPAPELSFTPSANDGEGSVEENVPGAVIITGIMVDGSVNRIEVIDAFAGIPNAGFADMFEVVRAGTTWNLKLRDNTELDFESIPGGTIRLSIFVESAGNNARSNILDVEITVMDVPDIAFSGTFFGSIAEDTASISGDITIDGRGSEPITISQGTYGTLTISGDTWTYRLDNNQDAVQGLLDGQNLQDQITVTVAGVSQNIAITINGANENLSVITGSVSAPSISLDNSVFDNNLFLGNILPDIRGQWDSNNPVSIAFAGTAPNFFTLSPSGDLRFTGTKANAEQLGDSVTLNLQVTAPDDTTETLPFTLQVRITSDSVVPPDDPDTVVPPDDPDTVVPPDDPDTVVPPDNPDTVVPEPEPEPEPVPPVSRGAVRVIGGDGVVQGAGVYFDVNVGVQFSYSDVGLSEQEQTVPNFVAAAQRHADLVARIRDAYKDAEDTDDGSITLVRKQAHDVRYGDSDGYVVGKGFITGASGDTIVLPPEFSGISFEARLDGAVNPQTGALLADVTYRSLSNAEGVHIASPITDLLVRRAADTGMTIEQTIAAFLEPNGVASSADISDFLERITDADNYVGGMTPDVQVIGIARVIEEANRIDALYISTPQIKADREDLFNLAAEYNQQVVGTPADDVVFDPDTSTTDIDYSFTIGDSARDVGRIHLLVADSEIASFEIVGSGATLTTTVNGAFVDIGSFVIDNRGFIRFNDVLSTQENLVSLPSGTHTFNVRVTTTSGGTPTEVEVTITVVESLSLTTDSVAYRIHENVVGADVATYYVNAEGENIANYIAKLDAPTRIYNLPLDPAYLTEIFDSVIYYPDFPVGSDITLPADSDINLGDGYVSFGDDNFGFYAPSNVVATITAAGSGASGLSVGDWRIEGAFAASFEMAQVQGAEWQLRLKSDASLDRELVKDGVFTLQVSALSADDRYSNPIEIAVNVLDLVEGTEITGDFSGDLVRDLDVDDGDLVASGQITIANKHLGGASVAISTSSGTARSVVRDSDANTLTATTAYGTFTYNLGTDMWEYSISNSASAVRGLGSGESLGERIALEITLPTGSTYTRMIDIGIHTEANEIYFVELVDNQVVRLTEVPSISEELIYDGSYSLRFPFVDLPRIHSERGSVGRVEFHLAPQTFPAGLEDAFAIYDGLLHFTGDASDLARHSDGFSIDVLVSATGTSAAPLRFSIDFEVSNVLYGGLQEDVGVQYAFPEKVGQVHGVFGANIVPLDKPIIGGTIEAVTVPTWLSSGLYTPTSATSFDTPSVSTSIITYDTTTHTWTYQGDLFPAAGTPPFTETITFTLTPEATLYPTASPITEMVVFVQGVDTGGQHYISVDGVRMDVASATETVSGTFKAASPTTYAITDDAEYGTFSFDADSLKWSYDLNDRESAVAALTEGGATLTDTITITGTAAGTNTDRTITITIGRDADGYTLTSAEGEIMRTDQTSETQGVAVQIDTTSGTAESVENILGGVLDLISLGAYEVTQTGGTTGTISFDKTAHTWTYTFDDPFQFPAFRTRGEETITFTITPMDTTIQAFDTSLDIEIHGGGSEFLNGEPYYAINGGEKIRIIVTNDGQQQPITLPIPGLEPTYAVTDSAEYGSFDFDAETLAWTYRLNEDASAVANLAVGDTLTDTITITTDHAFGADTTKTITITIERDANGYTTSASEGEIIGYYVTGKYGVMEYSLAGNGWTYKIDMDDPDTLALIEKLAGQEWIYDVSALNEIGDFLAQLQADERLGEVIAFKYTAEDGTKKTINVPIIYNRPDLEYIEVKGSIASILTDYLVASQEPITGTGNHGISPPKEIADIQVMIGGDSDAESVEYIRTVLREPDPGDREPDPDPDPDPDAPLLDPTNIVEMRIVGKFGVLRYNVATNFWTYEVDYNDPDTIAAVNDGALRPEYFFMETTDTEGTLDDFIIYTGDVEVATSGFLAGGGTYDRDAHTLTWTLHNEITAGSERTESIDVFYGNQERQTIKIKVENEGGNYYYTIDDGARNSLATYDTPIVIDLEVTKPTLYTYSEPEVEILTTFYNNDASASAITKGSPLVYDRTLKTYFTIGSDEEFYETTLADDGTIASTETKKWIEDKTLPTVTTSVTLGQIENQKGTPKPKGTVTISADGMTWSYMLNEAFTDQDRFVEDFTLTITHIDGTIERRNVELLIWRPDASVDNYKYSFDGGTTSTDLGSYTTAIEDSTGIVEDDNPAPQDYYIVGGNVFHVSSYDDLLVGHTSYGIFEYNTETLEWRFVVNNADPDIQALGADDTITEYVTLSFKHGDGTYTRETIEITINGADEEFYFADENGNRIDTIPEHLGESITEIRVPAKLAGRANEVELAPRGYTVTADDESTFGELTTDTDDDTWTYTPLGTLLRASAGDPPTTVTETITLTFTPTGGTPIPVDLEIVFEHTSDGDYTYSIDGGPKVAVTLIQSSGIPMPISGALPIPGLEPTYAVTDSAEYGAFDFDAETLAWTYSVYNGHDAVANLAIGSTLTDTVTITASHALATAPTTETITITIGRDADGIFFADGNGNAITNPAGITHFPHSGVKPIDTPIHEFYFKLKDIERGDLDFLDPRNGAFDPLLGFEGVVLGNILPEFGGDIELNNIRVEFAESTSETIKALFWVTRDGTLALSPDPDVYGNDQKAINQALASLDDELTLDFVATAPRDTDIELPYSVKINFVDEVNNDPTPEFTLAVEAFDATATVTSLSGGLVGKGTVTFSPDNKRWTYTAPELALGTFTEDTITITSTAPDGTTTAEDTITLFVGRTSGGVYYGDRPFYGRTTSGDTIAPPDSKVLDLTAGGHLATINYFDADIGQDGIRFGLLPDSSYNGMDAATYATHLSLLAIDEETGRIYLQDRVPQNAQDFRVAVAVTNHGELIHREFISIDVDGDKITNLAPAIAERSITTTASEGRAITIPVADISGVVTGASTDPNEEIAVGYLSDFDTWRFQPTKKPATGESFTMIATITYKDENDATIATRDFEIVARRHSNGFLDFYSIDGGPEVAWVSSTSFIVGSTILTAPLASVRAEDADGITYAITDGNDDALFVIDRTSGDIRVRDGAELDYESATQHILTVTATASNGKSTNAQVTINVANKNDGEAGFAVGFFGDDFLADADTLSVVKAFDDPDGMDADTTLNYQWFTTTDGGTTKDDITGITDTTSATLDTSSHTLASGATYGVTITYTDAAGFENSVDALAPFVGISTGTSPATEVAFVTTTINENSNALQEYISIRMFPTLDYTYSGNILYRFVDEDGAFVETLNGFEFEDDTSLELQSGVTLNYEEQNQYIMRMRIIFNDANTPTLEEDEYIETWIVVNVQDVDEYNPNFILESLADVEIPDSTAIGTLVTTIQAEDKDGTPDDPDEITYAITRATSGDASLFTIDENSGKITINTALPDITTPTTHTLEVTATSNGETVTDDITITIIDDPLENLAPIPPQDPYAG